MPSLSVPKKYEKRLASLSIIRGGVEDTRLEAKAKDRPSQGHGPRTQTQVFSKKKRRSSKFFFWRSQKKGLQKIFSGEKGLQKFFFRRPLLEETKKKVFADFPQGFWRFPTKFSDSKIVLSSSRGQGNFRELEASRPRTSSCVLEDVLKAKDVLEDSTSVNYII